MTQSVMSDGGAPENFHISFPNEDNYSNLSANTTPCPLCGDSRRSFHCQNCVRKGDFIHSSHHIVERFSEKQHRYKNLQAAHATLESKCVKLMERRRLSCQLRAEIKERTEKITIIRKLLDIKRENISKLQTVKKELREFNQKLRCKLPRYADQVNSMSDFVQNKLDRHERHRAKLTELQNELKQLRKVEIAKLIRDIFPISQAICNRASFSSSDGESRSTITEISDATKTAYVQGKWVLQDSFSEIQHIIVAPALPGNGNYSAYNDWATLNKTKDAVSSDEKSEDVARKVTTAKNPAYTIAGALTYTAQLVQMMSFYLGVILPHNVTYQDFCMGALSEAQFNHKVARLNANILYLCYSQGCRLNDLNPTHTIANIQHLLKSTQADLGRFGPMDRNFCLSDSVNADYSQHLGVDEPVIDDRDWEEVPSNLPDAIEADILPLAGNQLPFGNTHNYPGNFLYHHPQQLAAPPVSFIKSVTSFWKGFSTFK